MPGGLTAEHMRVLWERMVRIYGRKWVDNFGEIDDGTWLAGLFDVKPKQVMVGIDKCRTSSSPWPPTLPEFRAMCLPVKQKPFNVPLPRPPQDPEVAKKHLKDAKDMLGGKRRESK